MDAGDTRLQPLELALGVHATPLQGAHERRVYPRFLLESSRLQSSFWLAYRLGLIIIPAETLPKLFFQRGVHADVQQPLYNLTANGLA